MKTIKEFLEKYGVPLAMILCASISLFFFHGRFTGSIAHGPYILIGCGVFIFILCWKDGRP